jgi:hypothetical protein
VTDQEAKHTLRERLAERAERERQYQLEAGWGMQYMPDERQAAPGRLAWEAKQQGRRFFQIDIPIAYISGAIGVGTTASRTDRVPWTTDYLAEIEDQGWRLEHMTTVYVQSGSSATKRPLANVGSTQVATHGVLLGVYLFRSA